MAMIMPELTTATTQQGCKDEPISVFFNRVWQGLCASGNQEPPAGVTVDIETGLQFSLDINIKDSSLYYNQAQSRHDFFYYYLQQMWLILPSMKDFFVFVHGEDSDTLSFYFDILAGEIQVTNSRFSGGKDRVEDDFEKMVGVIYTQAIFAEYNLYKQGGIKVSTNIGECTFVVSDTEVDGVKALLEGNSISYTLKGETERIPFFLPPVIPLSGL